MELTTVGGGGGSTGKASSTVTGDLVVAVEVSITTYIIYILYILHILLYTYHGVLFNNSYFICFTYFTYFFIITIIVY